MHPGGIRNLVVAKSNMHTQVEFRRTSTRYDTFHVDHVLGLTFTFFRLHVIQPLLDLRCGFLLTKPALLRAILA